MVFNVLPGGQVVFNVFLADYDYSGHTVAGPFPQPWKAKAVKQLPDGRRLVIASRETGVDPVEQIWMEQRRYEVYDGETLVSEEIHSGQGRWYFRNELLWMLELAGFGEVGVTGDFTAEAFSSRHTTTMVFRATKARAS